MSRFFASLIFIWTFFYIYGQNLSKHALNALTVQAPTTELGLGKLFQLFTMRAEKNIDNSKVKRSFQPSAIRTHRNQRKHRKNAIASI